MSSLVSFIPRTSHTVLDARAHAGVYCCSVGWIRTHMCSHRPLVCGLEHSCVPTSSVLVFDCVRLCGSEHSCVPTRFGCFVCLCSFSHTFRNLLHACLSCFCCRLHFGVSGPVPGLSVIISYLCHFGSRSTEIIFPKPHPPTSLFCQVFCVVKQHFMYRRLKSIQTERKRFHTLLLVELK